MSLTNTMRKYRCDEVEGEAFNMTGESIPFSELKPLLLDRSMLEALGGPGERSILSQKKRSGDGGEQKDGTEEESREDDEAEEDVKRDEDKAEHDEDQINSEENSEEEDERGKPIVVSLIIFLMDLHRASPDEMQSHCQGSIVQVVRFIFTKDMLSK